jgi:hypothetical protein
MKNIPELPSARQSITLLFVSSLFALLFFSCSPPTPEQLAEDSCHCLQRAKTYTNGDRQIEEIDKCNGVVQSSLSQMQDIEKEQDMNTEQVKAFEERFDKVYDNCK